MDMFQPENVIFYPVEEEPEPKKSQTYEEVVKDIIVDEKQYLRDLHMITKVFRDILMRDKVVSTSAEIDAIFSNITWVTDLTVNLISSLEDTVEMTEEGHVPVIGQCFFELAEANEFDDYETYARDILDSNSKKTLDQILPKQIVSDALRSCGKGFREAVKYCLPKLLLGPIYHCFHYFNYIDLLRRLTDSKTEAALLKEVASMLTPLKNKLTKMVNQAGAAAKRKPGDLFHRPGPSRMSRQQSLMKLSQLQNSIANWDDKNLSSNSSEFICEGKLKVLDQRKKLSDRYVFLLDGMIIICKLMQQKRSSVSSYNPPHEYRLRDKHLIRTLDVIDREDGSLPSEKYMFELAPRDAPKIIFKAES